MAKKKNQFVVYDWDNHSFESCHDSLKEAQDNSWSSCIIIEVASVTDCFNKLSFSKTSMEDYV